MKAPQLLTQNAERICLLADQAVASAGSFLIGLVLVRQLGLAAFGLYTAGWMVVLGLAALHQAFWTQPWQTRLGQSQGADTRYHREVQTGQWLTGLVLGVAVLAVVPFLKLIEQDLTPPAWALGMVVASFLPHQFSRQAWLAERKSAQALGLDVGAFGSILLAFLLWQPASVTEAYVIVALGFAWPSWVITRRHAAVGAGLIATLVWHGRHGRWLLGTAGLQWITGNAYLAAGGLLLGPAFLGGFRLAQQTVGVLHVGFLVLESRVPVSLSAAFQAQGTSGLRRYLKRIVTKAAGPVVGAALILGVGAATWLELLYGPEARLQAPWLQALCGLYLLVFTGLPLRFTVRTVERTAAIFWSNLLTAALSALLAYPLVQAYGGWGVVSGLVINQVFTQAWLLGTLCLAWPTLQNTARCTSFTSYSAKPTQTA